MKLFGSGKKKNKKSADENAGMPMDVQEIFKQNLQYISQLKVDVDTIQRQFVKTESRFFLTVGTVDVPSGKVVVGDPLAYLPTGEYCPTLELSIPAGSYPVEVSLCRSYLTGIRMCTARLKVKATTAVHYELAKAAQGTAIGKCSDGDMTGFPVEAGMMCFIDASEAQNYQQFIQDWHKENPGKNHYDDYFAHFLAESAEKLPQFQRDDGDFTEWMNPDSKKRMVMAASGFGDGLYQAFWGFDRENEICELIVPMVNPDIIEEAVHENEDDFQWNGPRGCIVTKRISEDGCQVGYMYREEPLEGVPDSGWRFFEGFEDDNYVNDPDNSEIMDLADVCRANPDIYSLLDSAYGSAYYRDKNGKLQFEKLEV